ncbi:MAG: hypothetical protein ACYTG0_02865 [Planctomycetota bacterium]|jgi:hypothetical protein
MEKNVANQKWLVFAFDRTDNTPKTGDAANITAKIRKDYGTATATDDTNPTEIEDGYYEFDCTQVETNADVLDLLPESSTSNIQVIAVPGRVFTRPPNASSLSVDASGRIDLGKCAGSAVAAGAIPNASAGSSGGLPTVDASNKVAGVSGNVDGSVGSVTGSVGSVTGAVGSVTAGVSLTSAERNAVADALLIRDVDQVEAGAPEHSLCTVVLAVLESAVSGTTWTIKRTDGSTTHAVKTVTTDASATPITGVS